MISQFVRSHVDLWTRTHIDICIADIQLAILAGLDIALLAFTPDSILKLASYSRNPLVMGTSISVIGFAAGMFLSSWVEDTRTLQARPFLSFQGPREVNNLTFRVKARFRI